MKITVVSLFFLLHFILVLSAQDLPHFLTEAEKNLYNSYQFPVFEGKDVNPPETAVRTMAEWEELQGLLITWTSYRHILRQIVDYAQEEVTVYIVCSDSNSVKSYLTGYGIPLTNLKYVEAAYNSIWCRDYGPWSVYENEITNHSIVDWIYNRPRYYDDLIPGVMSGVLELPIYQTTHAPNDLTHTGGNFMTDGHGTGFSSNLILEENSDKTEAEIDTIMKNYMGIHRYIKMNTLPYDGIHHIDMHMKLLDEETLLVGQYPHGTADGPGIESNLQYILNNFQTCYGRPYKIVRIPMPPDAYGDYPDDWGDYRTYTNSVIVNTTVIVPTYEEQYDTTALRIYRQAMPGYTVVGIPCNDIIGSLGAIHCITKEIGSNEPVWISHAPLYDRPDTAAYLIEAQIKSAPGISQASLYWKNGGMETFMEVPLTAAENDSFYASIPQQGNSETLRYYISATNSSGKTICKPLPAPEGYWQFEVEQVTAVNDENISPAGSFTLYQNYPNPFNPSTVIRYHLPVSSEVELSVYNALGQKIHTLVSDKQNAGLHTVEWHAGNLPSGMYYYRLKTGDHLEQKKMVLLK